MSMNKQEVFDKVVNHMLTQNAKAQDDLGTCMYRGNEGRMCAVGCLITDEAYSPDIEKNAADTEEVLQALRNSGIDIDPWSPSNADSQFLYEIQQIHDYTNVDVWEKALVQFAEKNSLLFNWRP
jgi:hypothetical protein